jgi:hypothetical protein
MKNRFWSLLALCAVSFSVLAASLTLYASDFRWSGLNNVAGTGVSSEIGIRSAGSFVIIRLHNETPGQNNPVSTGQDVKIVWQDGSSETIKFKCSISPSCAAPVDGTQEPASGSSGSGPGGYPDDPGYVGGDNPFSDCFSETVTGCVSVGDGPMQCETYNVLNCPFG